MLKRIELRGVGPARELDISLAPRLNILTGDNGLGKTFVLDVAWWALTRGWSRAPAWPDPQAEEPPKIRCEVTGRSGGAEAVRSRYNFADQSWVAPQGRATRPAVVLYAHADGGFSVWDPARAARKDPAGSDPSAAYHFSTDALWNGLIEDGKVLCNGLIQDWVSWQFRDPAAFEQLVGVLKILSPGEQELLRPGAPVRVSTEDVRDIPTLEMPYGTVPLIYASAGIKRIVGFAYLLVWAWREHRLAAVQRRQVEADRVVFLIDEVEAHLHPRWERLILPALLSVMEGLEGKTRLQTLVTTHEPLVLASLEPAFDESTDRLILFELVEQQVHVSEVPWVKQGDAVGWLVSGVFGLSQARSRDAERAIEAAEAWMRKETQALPPGLETPEQIDAELTRVLAGHDPFWPRWIVSPRRHAGAAAGRR